MSYTKSCIGLIVLGCRITFFLTFFTVTFAFISYNLWKSEQRWILKSALFNVLSCIRNIARVVLIYARIIIPAVVIILGSSYALWFTKRQWILLKCFWPKRKDRWKILLAIAAVWGIMYVLPPPIAICAATLMCCLHGGEEDEIYIDDSDDDSDDDCNL